MRYAVQMYSVRDGIHNGEELLAALEKVRAIGYEGVEFAGVQGLSADVLKEKLDALGLVCVGTHISVDDFAPERLDATIAYYKTLGCKQIGVGGAATSTEKELTRVTEILGNACRVCEREGMKVYFHNHCGEFVPTKDSPDNELIINRLKKACYLQIDTYWSHHAGLDNDILLHELQDRICLIHLKDGNDGKPAAIGEGDCDIAQVLAAAKDIGMEWAIVENDNPVPNGFADIERSLHYLKTNF